MSPDNRGSTVMKNEMLIRNENSSEQPIVGSSATKSESVQSLYRVFSGRIKTNQLYDKLVYSHNKSSL